MDPITTQLSPPDYLLLQKSKISKEIKRLKDFVQQYKNIPEMKDEIMDCLQSLQQDLQHIESSVQRGEPPLSFNLNETHQHHGQDIESSVQRGEPPLSFNLNETHQHRRQEITQQNVYFGPTLNQENSMVMGPNAQSLSCSKRKRWSKVWEDFAKYVGEDGKEWAKCKHCKKEFVGSSKSGTTHLKNHLQSCPGLRNPSAVVDKVKEESMIGPYSNGIDFVRRIIKYGLSGIKNDILVVYEQEKCKSRGYIDTRRSRFSITIERSPWKSFWFMRIWFVDDSWELRNMIIFVAKCDYEDENEDEDEDDYYEILKSLFVDWNIHKKICSMFIKDGKGHEEVTKNLKNWFNEQGSLPFIGTIVSDYALLNKFYWDFFNNLKEISQNKIIAKASKLRDYIYTQCTVHQALSMGKIVTSQSVPPHWNDFRVLEWVMGCKEAFSDLELIDPHFKFINFTKEDWDDATLLYSGSQVLLDLEKEISNLLDLGYENADVNFQILCHIISKLVQLCKSDNYYICHVASLFKENLAEYWENSRSVLEVRVILDPRYKLEMVGHIYKIIYNNDFEIQLQKTIGDVTNVFNEYVMATSSSSLSHDYNATSKSELDYYLRDEFPQDERFDILQWWCDKSSIYPTLAKMASDFLSIPVKIPDLESYLEDEIIDIYSSNDLDDDIKSKLVCTKDWLNFFENN